MKKIYCRIFYRTAILLLAFFSHKTILSQSTNISGIINTYASVTGIDTTGCPSKVVVNSTVGFFVGDSVLIIQMKGADFDSTNTASFGTLLNLKGAGNYEIAKITAIVSNTIHLNGILLNPYFLSGIVQLVRIPNYTNAIVTAPLGAQAWNGTTGGVLILTVQNALQLNANIDVAGSGFREGTISNNPDGGCGSGSPLYYYPLIQVGSPWASGGAQKGEGIGTIAATKQAGRGPLVNGGGGGNKHNTGGGGGSNFTAGGKGGDGLSGCNHTTGGLGGLGLSVPYLNNKLFMGGGGGCGDFNNAVGSAGMRGGGIAIIISGSITGSGRIRADGLTNFSVGGAAADGMGGGGGGGVIFIKTNVFIGTFTIQANGGSGGNQGPSGYCVGPGGGGGTGAILTNLGTLASLSTSLIPGNAGIHISGTCINSPYGATSGSVNTVGPLTNKNLVYTPSVNPNLTITATSSQSMICTGTSVTLTAGGASTYTWLPGSITGSNISVTPTSSQVYTVSGSNPGGCYNLTTLSQIVNPTPTLAAAANPTFICSGASVSLTVSGANTYTWLPGNMSGSLVVISPTASTIYTAIGQSTAGCTSSISISHSVNPTPTLTAISSASSICQGGTAVLSVSGANSYTWSTGFNTNTVLVSPNANTTYSVSGSSLGCNANAFVNVNLKPSPTLSFTTFSITCGSLGSATANTSGGIGPFSYTWMPTNQNGSSVGGLFPGTYTLLVLDLGTGCSYSPTTTFFPLVPLTGTVSSSGSLSCNGVNTATATIALAGGSGSQTYTWSSSSGSQFNAQATGLPAGITTVSVMDALTFCSVSHTFLITQPTPLMLNLSASSSSVCLGGSIQFSAVVSGGIPGYTYTWTNGPATNTRTVTETTGGIYNYTFTGEDANQCLISGSISGAFIPNPTLSVNSVSICPAANGILLAAGATTYTWSTNFVGNPLTVSPALNTVYTLTGSALSCTATASASVSLLPAPTASATNGGAICTGQTLLLSGSGGTPLWSGPLNFTSNVFNPNINFATAGHSGIYSLKVTAANGCTASAITIATVYPIPFLSVLGSTVCEGQTANLYSYFTAGNLFSWTGPGSFSSALQSPVLNNASTTLNGAYSLTATSAVGCTNTAIAQISVVPNPSITLSSNSPQCAGSQVTVSANGANTYVWSGPNGFFTSNPQFTLNNIPVSSGGVYTLNTSFGPCSSQPTLMITVFPLPLPTANNTGPVCELKPLQLIGAGGSTYTWTGPGGFSSNQQTVLFSSATVSVSGNYTLQVNDVNGCAGSAFSAVSILLNPLPIASGASVCIGGSATLSVLGGISYAWSGPAGFTSSSPIVVIPQVSTLTAGQYSIITSAANSCTVQNLVSLVAMPYPLPVPVISTPPEVCLNTTLNLQGSGGEVYFWVGPQQFVSHLQNVSIPVNQLNVGGTYTLSVTNASGCVASTTLFVTVYNLPQINSTSQITEACVPFCTKIEVSPLPGTAPLTTAGFYIYNAWYSGSTLNYCFSEAGVHIVRAEVQDSNLCINSSTLTILAHPQPQAEFYYTPLSPLANIDEVLFTNSSTGAAQTAWSWFFMANNNDTLQQKNTSFLFVESGTYPVALLVTNKWGCTDTVIKLVLVEDEFGIYIPNSFTPNGDGLNDIFQPKGSSIRSYQLEVFDRWGARLFFSNDFYSGWDGYYKGSLCKSDSYIYKINVSNVSGKNKEFSGSIQLIR